MKPEDLRDPARLLDLHAQAVAAGYVSPSEAEQLRRVLYHEAALEGAPHGGAPRRSAELSDDARFVREVTKLLRQRGVPEPSMWRLVNRERPAWTRERWDEAQAELRGELPTMAAASVLS